MAGTAASLSGSGQKFFCDSSMASRCSAATRAPGAQLVSGSPGFEREASFFRLSAPGSKSTADTASGAMSLNAASAPTSFTVSRATLEPPLRPERAEAPRGLVDPANVAIEPREKDRARRDRHGSSRGARRDAARADRRRDETLSPLAAPSATATLSNPATGLGTGRVMMALRELIPPSSFTTFLRASFSVLPVCRCLVCRCLASPSPDVCCSRAGAAGRSVTGGCRCGAGHVVAGAVAARG